MSQRGKIVRYIREYKGDDMVAMMRNNSADPLVCSADFGGRLVVITGATSGIGYATARKYAHHGADLLCINRNSVKSDALCREIESEFAVRCNDIIADMSDLSDVRRVAQALIGLERPIDVLIHNAGVYLTHRRLTVDGLELVFVVNYLSSFLLNYLLRERLRSQEAARIILVNSEAHRFSVWGLRLDDLLWEKRRYSGLGSYGAAKMAQLLSMLMFDEWFAGSGVTINAVHPGSVKTDSGKDNGRFYKWFKTTVIERNFRPPAISAEALYFMGASEAIGGLSGKFFNLTTVENPAPPSMDRDTAKELWTNSLELLKKFLDDPAESTGET